MSNDNFGPCLLFFVNFLTLWRNSSYRHPSTPRKFPPFSPPPPRNFLGPSFGGGGGVWIFSGTAHCYCSYEISKFPSKLLIMQARDSQLGSRFSVNPMNSLGQESATYSYCTCLKLYTDDFNFSRGLVFTEKLFLNTLFCLFTGCENIILQHGSPAVTNTHSTYTRQ